MMKTTKTSLLQLLATLFLSSALSAGSPTLDSLDLFSFTAEVDHTEGHGVGYTKGYTSLDLRLVGSMYSCGDEQPGLFPLLDLRGIGFDDGKRAANAGAGLRVLTWDDAAVGAIVYYDFRQSHHELFDSVGRGFNQLGLSLEYLSDPYDLRLNLYQPLGKKRWHYKQSYVETDEGPTHVVVKRRHQSTVQMIDAEIGKLLATGSICRDCIDWTAYLAAGPYYFKEAGKSGYWGGRARLLTTFATFFELELRSTYDALEKGEFQCRLGITLPLYPNYLKTKGRRFACETVSETVSASVFDRLTQPIFRSEIVPLSH